MPATPLVRPHPADTAAAKGAGAAEFTAAPPLIAVFVRSAERLAGVNRPPGVPV
jgi:hypothetical protein